MGLMKQFFCNEMAARNTDLLNYPTACMLYAAHLVSMLHPEPAWIHPSGVLKYTSSTYAIIFLCPIYETVGFNKPNIESRDLFGSVLLFFDGHVIHWSSVLESYPAVSEHMSHCQFPGLESDDCIQQ